MNFFSVDFHFYFLATNHTKNHEKKIKSMRTSEVKPENFLPKPWSFNCELCARSTQQALYKKTNNKRVKIIPNKFLQIQWTAAHNKTKRKIEEEEIEISQYKIKKKEIRWKIQFIFIFKCSELSRLIYSEIPYFFLLFLFHNCIIQWFDNFRLHNRRQMKG